MHFTSFYRPILFLFEKTKFNVIERLKNFSNQKKKLVRINDLF